MNSTNDLDRAIAAAREAVARVDRECSRTDDDAYMVECARAAARLVDLLAALDAARSQAVWQVSLPKNPECWSDYDYETTANAVAKASGNKCREVRAVFLAPPAAAVPARTLAEYHEDFGPVVWWRFPVEEHAWIGTPNDDDWPGYHTHWTPHPEVPAMLAAAQAQQPAALAVPAGNVTPMRQPRADLARLVESINAAVYANGDGLSVTEAIGALELAKLELLKEQEQ